MTPIRAISAMVATVLVVAGGAALAQTTPEIPDSDGNGLWSLSELQTKFPDLSEEAFISIDANADGGVDKAELTAAISDGAITLPVE